MWWMTAWRFLFCTSWPRCWPGPRQWSTRSSTLSKTANINRPSSRYSTAHPSPPQSPATFHVQRSANRFSAANFNPLHPMGRKLAAKPETLAKSPELPLPKRSLRTCCISVRPQIRSVTENCFKHFISSLPFFAIPKICCRFE